LLFHYRRRIEALGLTKALIIATGRCGSSALARAIKEAYLCDEWYDEPFNPDLNSTNEITGVREFDENKGKSYDFTAPWKDVPPNTVWKCLLTLDNHPEEYKDIVEFFLDFSKQFEKVILLSRRNNAERFYSLMMGIQHSQWHRRYWPLDVTINAQHFITINDFFDQNKRIETLADKMNTEIFYYEDLFTDEEMSNKTWNKMLGETNDFEATYLRWLQPKLRYRMKPEEAQSRARLKNI
jgi:hypothetical protein